MNKPKMICFDMDGTIADLYAVENWEPKLRNFDPTPYAEAAPMWDMVELALTLTTLQKVGVQVAIVTWLGKNSSKDYKNAVRKTKREWLNKYEFPYDIFHGVQYGTTKANCVRSALAPNETAILVDDNAKVRKGWTLGETIDPTTVDLIEVLKALL